MDDWTRIPLPIEAETDRRTMPPFWRLSAWRSAS